MQRLWARHIAFGPRQKGPRESVPPQLLHLPCLSEAAVDRRRTLRPRRQQVYLQGGLPIWEDADHPAL